MRFDGAPSPSERLTRTSTSLNTGTAGQSWNETFKITNATFSPATITQGVNTYSCVYPYSITSVGTAQGSEQQTVTETGNITLVVTGASATNNVSFAYFGAFVDVLPRRPRAAGSRHHDRTDVHEHGLGIHGQPAALDGALCFYRPCWAGMGPSGLLGYGLGPALGRGKQLGIGRESHRPGL